MIIENMKRGTIFRDYYILNPLYNKKGTTERGSIFHYHTILNPLFNGNRKEGKAIFRGYNILNLLSNGNWKIKGVQYFGANIFWRPPPMGIQKEDWLNNSCLKYLNPSTMGMEDNRESSIFRRQNFLTPGFNILWRWEVIFSSFNLNPGSIICGVKTLNDIVN